MNCLKILPIGMLACSLSSQAAIIFYSDQTTWVNAVGNANTELGTSSLNLDISTFQTNYANVQSGTGIAFPELPLNSGDGCNANSFSSTDCLRLDGSQPYNNVDLGDQVTFNNTTTNGFAWDFELSTFETNSTVIFNDIPALDSSHTYEEALAFEDSLSIGKYNGFAPNPDTSDDLHNDNFTFEITSGPDLYAFGFNLLNNQNSPSDGFDSNEWLEVFTNKAASGVAFNNDDDNNPGRLGQFDQIPGGGQLNNELFFVGVLSDTPFTWLEFNESNSANDIAVQDFFFAANVSAVPVPAAVWLFGSGVLFLIGLRRKNPITH